MQLDLPIALISFALSQSVLFENKNDCIVISPFSLLMSNPLCHSPKPCGHACSDDTVRDLCSVPGQQVKQAVQDCSEKHCEEVTGRPHAFGATTTV